MEMLLRGIDQSDHMNYTMYSEPVTTQYEGGHSLKTNAIIGVLENITMDENLSYEDKVRPSQPCQDDLSNCRVQNYIFIVAAPILVILALTGNTISFVTMMRPKLRKTATAMFIAALAISDTVVALTGLTRHFILKLTKIDVRNFSPFSCQIHRFILYVSLNTSAWILVAVTVERFVAVCFPGHHKHMRSRTKALKTIACIIPIQMAISFQVFFTRGREYIESAVSNYSNETASIISANCGYPSEPARNYWTFHNGWISLINYCLLPFTIMLILNIAIIKRLRRMRRSMLSRASSAMSTTGLTRHTNSMTRMLLSVTFYFIVVTTPAFMYSAIEQLVIYTSRVDPEQYARMELIDAVLTVLLYLNHSINFFLYCLTGRRFRRELQEILGCVLPAHQKEFTNIKIDSADLLAAPNNRLLKVSEQSHLQNSSVSHL